MSETGTCRTRLRPCQQQWLLMSTCLSIFCLLQLHQLLQLQSNSLSLFVFLNSPLLSTTMLTRLLWRSLPTRPSLQVQPENHSNYNRNAKRQWQLQSRNTNQWTAVTQPATSSTCEWNSRAWWSGASNNNNYTVSERRHHQTPSSALKSDVFIDDGVVLPLLLSQGGHGIVVVFQVVHNLTVFAMVLIEYVLALLMMTGECCNSSPSRTTTKHRGEGDCCYCELGITY